MQTDATGNAIVYDVYARPRGAGGAWGKDHGEYTEEAAAQRACDRLNAERPDHEHKPRKRRGLKAACYKG